MATVFAALMAFTVVQAQPDGSDLKGILARNEIRVALPADEFIPFVSTGADGTTAGLEPDLARDIARRLKVRLRFVRTARTQPELVAQVRAGEADIAIGQIADSLELAKFVRFSIPYITLFEVDLVDRLAATRAGGVAALLARPDARIATTEYSAVASFLREQIGPDRMLLAPTVEAAVAAVRQGRAVAAAGDDVVMPSWLAAHAEAGVWLQTTVRRDKPLSVALAMHWSAEDLQAWLNLYLEKSVHDETMRKLAVRHLGLSRLLPAE